jgi:uncharacterized protein (DUF885 family)
MKITFLFSTAALLTLLACNNPKNSDAEFETLANHYIEVFLKINPEWATQLGDHRYDHELYNFSPTAMRAEAKTASDYLDSLAAIDPAKLNPTNQIDYEILKSQLQYTVFSIDTLREQDWNPQVYNIGQGIYGLIARDFAPMKERLTSVNARLKALPKVLEQAKQNLKNPPKVHTETSIMQNEGNIAMIRDELDQFIQEAPEMKDELGPARQAAVEALTAYGKWMQDELLPNSNGDFRLGDVKWRRKLHYSLGSDLTKEQILDKAQNDLAETQAKMYETAAPLYEKFFGSTAPADKKQVIKAVLDKLAESRPTNETIVSLAKQKLETTTAFVRDNALISVPDEPVEVIVMPEFQRGVAVAYCDPPGPLEKNAKTFFAISPTPADWSSERVESFFKEYNNYMLEDLTIHEAMPGHYLQLAHSNKFQAPTMIRAIFYSGTFVEGWATYAEQLMAESGYGGPEVRMQQLKMRLRLIINSIIDQKIHTEGMTEQEAIDLMKNEGFQEDGEAVGKWRRACLTSTQLSTYYVGNMEINDIRDSYEAAHGNEVNVKDMHDQMLSFGSPPPKYVKRMLGLGK